MTTAKITRTINRALTVEQLIEELQAIGDQQARVVFVCDYGDRAHTQQALVVNDVLDVSIMQIAESAYSTSGLRFDEDADIDVPEFEDCHESLVVLRSN